MSIILFFFFNFVQKDQIVYAIHAQVSTTYSQISALKRHAKLSRLQLASNKLKTMLMEHQPF